MKNGVVLAALWVTYLMGAKVRGLMSGLILTFGLFFYKCWHFNFYYVRIGYYLSVRLAPGRVGAHRARTSMRRMWWV